jgi:hypothetical protein
MAGQTRDDDHAVDDDVDGAVDGAVDDTRPRHQRRRARRSGPDSVPSLDDAAALQSLPDVPPTAASPEPSDPDAIPSLDDTEAVISLPGEEPAASSSTEAVWSTPGAGAAVVARRGVDAAAFDERQVVTQIVARRGVDAAAFDERQVVTQIVARARGPDGAAAGAAANVDERTATPVVARSPARRVHRSALVVAALVVVVVVVVGVGAVVAARRQGLPVSSSTLTVAPPPSSPDVAALIAVAEQTLATLQAAFAAGDPSSARALVGVGVWPAGEPSPPASLARALSSPALARPGRSWMALPDGAVRLQWSDDAAFAGLGKRHALTLGPVDGRLQATAWQSEGLSDAAAVDALLVFARAAVDERDGERLLSLVRPGPATCTRQTCVLVKRAVTGQRAHPFVDAVTLGGLVDGSLRATPERGEDAGSAVRLRYLRRTRAAGLPGVVDVVVAPVDGAWRFIAVDATHATAVERELAAWQAEHAQLAWRGEVAGLVELTALPVTCARTILAWCAHEIAPTRVKNTGDVAIRRLQITKVVAGKPAASPWAIWNDLAPGAAADTPARTSPAPAGKGFLELRTFDAYRVDWIELHGGRRLAPATIPVPDDVDALAAVRRKARADTATLTTLRARLATLGYPDADLARLSSPSSPSSPSSSSPSSR